MNHDELTPDDLLNKTIAQMKGYSVYRHVYDNAVKSVRWVLLDPTGKPVLHSGDGREQMIINGVQHTVESLRSENAAWRSVPNFSKSLDAAMQLVPKHWAYNLFLEHFDENTHTCELFFYNHNDDPDGLVYSSADTPAEAMCRAFIKWATAERQPNWP